MRSRSRVQPPSSRDSRQGTHADSRARSARTPSPRVRSPAGMPLRRRRVGAASGDRTEAWRTRVPAVPSRYAPPTWDARSVAPCGLEWKSEFDGRVVRVNSARGTFPCSPVLTMLREGHHVYRATRPSLRSDLGTGSGVERRDRRRREHHPELQLRGAEGSAGLVRACRSGPFGHNSFKLLTRSIRAVPPSAYCDFAARLADHPGVPADPSSPQKGRTPRLRLALDPLARHRFRRVSTKTRSAFELNTPLATRSGVADRGRSSRIDPERPARAHRARLFPARS